LSWKHVSQGKQIGQCADGCTRPTNPVISYAISRLDLAQLFSGQLIYEMKVLRQRPSTDELEGTLLSEQEFNEVIERFLEAIETHNEAGLHEVYRDDIVIWHSFTNATMPKDASIAMLAGLWRDGIRMRYVFDDQLVVGNRGGRRHRVEATTRGGRRIVLQVAMFATVEDGKISRLDEYVDSKEVEALGAAVAADLEVG
jgi:ketosteroid isomerase-like protein